MVVRAAVEHLCVKVGAGVIHEPAEEVLDELGLKIADVDRYAVELHNPEITVPSGSGDVPRTTKTPTGPVALDVSPIEDSILGQDPGSSPAT
jgi:hypothetical protein